MKITVELAGEAPLLITAAGYRGHAPHRVATAIAAAVAHVLASPVAPEQPAPPAAPAPAVDFAPPGPRRSLCLS